MGTDNTDSIKAITPDTGGDVKKLPDPSVFGDLWQSAKYMAVQKSYDGLAQLANHLGADIKERNLIDKPADPTTTSHQIAQDIGYGIGSIPGIAALYLASREGVGRITGETASSFSIMRRAELSVNELAFAGGLYDGLTTVSSKDNFWSDRAKSAAIGGMTFYAMGKTQLKMQGAAGLVGRDLSTDVLANITQRAGNAGIGLIAGSAGGLVNAESKAILNDHRLAKGDEIQSAITRYGAFGLGLGAFTTAPGEGQPLGYKRTGMDSPLPQRLRAQPIAAEVKIRTPLPNLNERGEDH